MKKYLLSILTVFVGLGTLCGSFFMKLGNEADNVIVSATGGEVLREENVVVNGISRSMICYGFKGNSQNIAISLRGLHPKLNGDSAFLWERNNFNYLFLPTELGAILWQIERPQNVAENFTTLIPFPDGVAMTFTVETKTGVSFASGKLTGSAEDTISGIRLKMRELGWTEFGDLTFVKKKNLTNFILTDDGDGTLRLSAVMQKGKRLE